MPCDTVRTVRLNLEGMRTDLVNKVLARLGLPKLQAGQTVLSFISGSVARDETILATVKRGYAEEVVKSQATRFGWGVKTSVNKEGRKVLSLVRSV